MTSHRDIVQGMADAMGTMGTYIVMAFCASLFIAAFGKSNLGALLALKGASGLQALGLPSAVTLVGIVGLSGFVDLFIGSASAKWALLAPILVPMLMTLGISPELTQAAYRIGDSTTNIITPLMPYFPAGGGLHPALGEVGGHRHAGVADVALLAGVPGRLDRAAAGRGGARACRWGCERGRNGRAEQPANITWPHKLQIAEQIALEAGAILLEGWERSPTVEFKTAERDLVTEYDRRSEALIVSRLRQAFPEDAIVGEEGASHAGSAAAGDARRDLVRGSAGRHGELQPRAAAVLRVDRPAAARRSGAGGGARAGGGLDVRGRARPRGHPQRPGHLARRSRRCWTGRCW